MASPRSTPFIASWDSDESLDATAPLDEILAAHASPPAFARPPRAPSTAGPSRRAWSVVGIAAVVAAGALLWAAENDRPRPPAILRSIHTPPPPVRAELQTIPARIDLAPPDIAWAEVDETSASPPRHISPARPRPQPRDELAAALLERRKQMSLSGSADVDAVAAIHFDPSRRSARVVYHVARSAAEIVEYWAVRDGHWQPLDD